MREGGWGRVPSAVAAAAAAAAAAASEDAELEAEALLLKRSPLSPPTGGLAIINANTYRQ